MSPKTVTFNQSYNKAKCISFFYKYDFHIIKEDEHIVLLKKSGTIFTFSGKKMPMELSIQFRDDSTKFSLKYDAFVLFDTGDLQEELDKLSSGLTQI